MTLTCCQDHILTENIWFVWSETSYSGDERRCHRCGTTNDKRQTVKIELLSQWKLEAEFRNLMFGLAGVGLSWTNAGFGLVSVRVARKVKQVNQIDEI